jgi:sorbose reductase
MATSMMQKFSLKGKTLFLTGGSRGIGYQLVNDFASIGCQVCMGYNSSKDAVKLAEEMTKKWNVKVEAYKVNVSDRKAVQEAVDKCLKEFGGLDIAIGNAGIPWTKGSLIDNDPEEAAQSAINIMNIDLLGPMYLAQAVGPIFKKQGHGSLIYTASMSGHIVNVPNYQMVYNAAKAGVIHMTKSLAVEWAPFARVNCVSPVGFGESSFERGLENTKLN